ncbi:MAG TPA: TlpA disulfide reductase family protein [Phototrophicaceae bacterium]|nr:TlpA disulfide reductase family protein [Phototrophicaceae bacterium]
MSNKRLRQRQAARRRQPVLVWVIIGLILIIIGVMVASLAQPSATAATPLFSARTTDGETVALADYQGQVVMLNFWATWCPPCRAEMPVIEAAYQHYREQGFTVLAVNDAEPGNLVQTFATQYGLSFPVLLDETAQIQRQFGITGYPTSIFLDASGNIYATHSGGLNAALLANYIETGLKRSVQ